MRELRIVVAIVGETVESPSTVDTHSQATCEVAEVVVMETIRCKYLCLSLF